MSLIFRLQNTKTPKQKHWGNISSCAVQYKDVANMLGENWTCPACQRGRDEDAMRKLLPWNVGLTGRDTCTAVSNLYRIVTQPRPNVHKPRPEVEHTSVFELLCFDPLSTCYSTVCRQGHSDGGYIGIYTGSPPKKKSVYLTNFYVVTGCFFSFTQDKLLLILKLE